MLLKVGSNKRRMLIIPPAEISAPRQEDSESERRRQMYERIAMGNALAEAEEDARRKWRGK